MSVKYTVQQGDCLSSIAKQFGFVDWKSIYYREVNDEFRKLRPNPHVLMPGDVLQIPDKRVKNESCQTGQVNTFQVIAKKTRLRLVVRGIDGQPLEGKKYKLTVEGDTHEGVLPAGALLDVPIAADAIDGELKVWAEDDYPDLADTWKLRLGHLDPVDQLTGVQARLNNLGYDCGPVDGVNGPRTRAAVKAFQKDHSLDVDGIPGLETQAAIQSTYGI